MSDRVLSYPEAIREATDQAMSSDPGVIVMGLGVTDPKGILGTTIGLVGKYGTERVVETPLSEDAMTGAAIGMALAGLKPIHVHIRVDFLMLSMNQLVNMASKIRYMHGGQQNVPLVVRAIIGKSWGQGAQHSQALHAFFMHTPGIRVVAPATPRDAKGALLHAIADPNPVLMVEHRMLYYQRGPVPEERFETPPGRCRVVETGTDITIVGLSFMQVECYRAAKYLREIGISPEVIDPIWLSPLDIGTIAESARKTGRVLIVDNAWLACGASAEIMARLAEELQPGAVPVMKRMGFAPVPCPTTPSLEEHFYPNARTIASAARRMVKGGNDDWAPAKRDEIEELQFKGPF
jgi:pyruvate/2-oxoglutarate/acetoin dehydrogenase E1 component